MGEKITVNVKEQH